MTLHYFLFILFIQFPKKVFHGVDTVITLFTLGMSTYIPMLIANNNTHAKEVPIRD